MTSCVQNWIRMSACFLLIFLLSFRQWVGTRNNNYRKCAKEQVLKYERGETPTTKVDSQKLRPLKTPSTQSSASDEVLTKAIATPKMKMLNVLSKAKKRQLAVTNFHYSYKIGYKCHMRYYQV